jgi:hypothetical protein
VKGTEIEFQVPGARSSAHSSARLSPAGAFVPTVTTATFSTVLFSEIWTLQCQCDYSFLKFPCVLFMYIFLYLCRRRRYLKQGYLFI